LILIHILLDINPSPDKYNIPSTFETNNTTSTFTVHVKGKLTYCFGAGRDELQKQVIHREKLQPDPVVPGPGSYDPLKPIGENTRFITLKGKLDYGDPSKTAIKLGVPGVGTYKELS